MCNFIPTKIDLCHDYDAGFAMGMPRTSEVSALAPLERVPKAANFFETWPPSYVCVMPHLTGSGVKCPDGYFASLSKGENVHYLGCQFS